VWSQLEKADSSFAEFQKWSQRSLPLRQRQKVEKMLRRPIGRAHGAAYGARKQPTRVQWLDPN
jgi:hypothetical protein